MSHLIYKALLFMETTCLNKNSIMLVFHNYISVSFHTECCFQEVRKSSMRNHLLVVIVNLNHKSSNGSSW